MKYFKPLLMLVAALGGIYFDMERIAADTDQWYTWVLLVLQIWLAGNSLETIDARATAPKA